MVRWENKFRATPVRCKLGGMNPDCEFFCVPHRHPPAYRAFNPLVI